MVTDKASLTDTVPYTVVVKPDPRRADATGVGDGTTQNAFNQFSADFNSTVAAAASHLANWDATNPVTGQIGDSIPVKQGCTAIARPDGSSAGISALATTQIVSGVNCINFARSSRARVSSDPPYAPGGVAFVSLAGDAVSWATPAVNTAAPATLTTSQLNAIYTCSVTNWNQVGGGNQTIAPFLPQSGSGTLSFFLASIGVTTPGPCVSNDNNTLEENEGVNPVLNNPGASTRC